LGFPGTSFTGTWKYLDSGGRKVIILITGTPGTGKSEVSDILAKMLKFKMISIEKIAGDACVGIEKGSKIIDIGKLSEKLKEIRGNVIIEGHLSHLLPFGDLVIVLRTKPKILKKRLQHKGFDDEKLMENLEAEALDVCLIESVENHDNVFEIDTSEKKPLEVAKDILAIVNDEKRAEFSPGKIDWTYEFFDVKSQERIICGYK
jgi:adenylate kinase